MGHVFTSCCCSAPVHVHNIWSPWICTTPSPLWLDSWVKRWWRHSVAFYPNIFQLSFFNRKNGGIITKHIQSWIYHYEFALQCHQNDSTFQGWITKPLSNQDPLWLTTARGIKCLPWLKKSQHINVTTRKTININKCHPNKKQSKSTVCAGLLNIANLVINVFSHTQHSS